MHHDVQHMIFMIDRYPTFEDNQTTEFFLNWFGAVNFVAYVGIFIWVLKVLDRAFFAYAIPVVLLQLIMDCYVNAANWWRKLYRSLCMDNFVLLLLV